MRQGQQVSWTQPPWVQSPEVEQRRTAELISGGAGSVSTRMASPGCGAQPVLVMAAMGCPLLRSARTVGTTTKLTATSPAEPRAAGGGTGSPLDADPAPEHGCRSTRAGSDVGSGPIDAPTGPPAATTRRAIATAAATRDASRIVRNRLADQDTPPTLLGSELRSQGRWSLGRRGRRSLCLSVAVHSTLSRGCGRRRTPSAPDWMHMAATVGSAAAARGRPLCTPPAPAW